MSLVQHFRALFAYDAWANRETLESLERCAPPPASGVRLLGHVAAAKQLWLSRIQGRSPTVAVWPELNLEGCRSLLAEADSNWTAYIAALSPDQLSQSISYINSKREAWTSVVEDILTHVALHSHYHRGQIAAQIRAAGHAPAYTDYIHAVRTQSLPPEEILHD
jgi:uncharacterized damage-inducible protein DinB